MRVNVYAEELTDRIEIIEKETPDGKFTGLRFYLELPVTIPARYIKDSDPNPQPQQIRGPFIHRPGDDDSAAVTFWGKRDLREVLRNALMMLDRHYAAEDAQYVPVEIATESPVEIVDHDHQQAVESLRKSEGENIYVKPFGAESA